MKSKRKSREPSTLAGSGYRQGIRQADEIIAKHGVEIRADNWQQLALEWFASHEPQALTFNPEPRRQKRLLHKRRWLFARDHVGHVLRREECHRHAVAREARGDVFAWTVGQRAD